MALKYFLISFFMVEGQRQVMECLVRNVNMIVWAEVRKCSFRCRRIGVAFSFI